MRLVLFDIDGTLLWPDGAGRASLKIALREVYGTAGAIDSYQFAGHTDRETVARLMGEAGIPAEVIWERFDLLAPAITAALEHLVQEKRHNIRPCPGAVELVAVLAARTDAVQGLITGNLRPSARVKLQAAGFDPELFQVGAFGDVSERRGDLPPVAVEQAHQITGIEFKGRQVVIIGDTPADITCGHGIGARSISVMTGWTEREVLASHRPDFLLDDLGNTDAVLAAIFASVDED